MGTTAFFREVPRRAGMYESLYLRAVSPEEPIGVWVRHTIHKRPGAAPRGSLWFTLFDARRGAPLQHKLTVADPGVPEDGWIDIGGATIGPTSAVGACGEAAWSLRYTSSEPELRHLAPAWLYRAPLPRTKLTSPAPAARFDGVIELAGRDPLQLAGWPGMVGHNWGSEHAERWIWLHGMAFDGEPGDWLDIALGRVRVGRVRVGRRTTPWVANGTLALEGRRHRLGGLAARGLSVVEHADGCSLRLGGRHGLAIGCEVRVPPGSAAGWRYADPDGGEHDVIHCSVAALDLSVQPFRGAGRRLLRTVHGAAYELGMRERDHGVPIAPFPDG